MLNFELWTPQGAPVLTFQDACIVFPQIELLYLLRKFSNILQIYLNVKIWTPPKDPVMSWGHSFNNLESTLSENA